MDHSVLSACTHKFVSHLSRTRRIPVAVDHEHMRLRVCACACVHSLLSRPHAINHPFACECLSSLHFLPSGRAVAKIVPRATRSRPNPGNFPIYLFLVRLRIPQSKQTTDCDKKATTTSQPNFFVQLRTKTIFQFFGLQLFGPQSEQLKIVGAFQSEDCDIVYVHVFLISRLFLGSGVVIRAPITFFFGRGAMESAATHCLNGLYLRNVTSSKRTPTRTVFLASTYLSPLERLGCR